MGLKVNPNTPEFNAFLSSAIALVNDNYKQYENLTPPKFSVDWGRRYARLVTDNGTQRGVYCFVDRTNGDVLKSASWKAPAKIARGNIFDADRGTTCLTPYGAMYLR